MEKREFLARLAGAPSSRTAGGDAAFSAFANRALPKRAAITAGLEPFAGAWNKGQASHLLRRCLFAFTPADIEKAMGLSMAACVDALLNVSAEAPPAPPLAYEAGETAVASGQTWIGSARTLCPGGYSSRTNASASRDSRWARPMRLAM